MILKLGKEHTAMVEEEARNRGLAPGALGRLIIAQFFMLLSDERAKKVRRIQSKRLGASTGITGASTLEQKQSEVT